MLFREGFQSSLLGLLDVMDEDTSPRHLGVNTDWDVVIGDLALTNMAVGNKAAPVALSKQAVNLVLLKKTRSMIPRV